MNIPMLTKGRMAALEKVWEREIAGTLPHQSNARIYSQLESEGLVERVEESIPTGLGSLCVRGWSLTHAGRFAYCASCPCPETRK